MNERRLKTVLIKESELVDILNWRHEDAGTILSLEGPEIPKDARVHHCYYDAERMSMAVVLYHDSFPVVSENWTVPFISSEGTRVIRKCAEGSLELVDSCPPPSIDQIMGRADFVDHKPAGEDFRNHRYLGTHFTSDNPEVTAELVGHRYAALAHHPENVVTNILSEGNGQFLIEFYEKWCDLSSDPTNYPTYSASPLPAPPARSAAESAHPELWEGLQGSSEQGFSFSPAAEELLRNGAVTQKDVDEARNLDEESSTDWFQRVMGNG